MLREGEGGLQWGPGGWGGVTCWVTAATKLTPPVSPVTGSGHHVSPDASLQDGWAPFLGPGVQKSAWHGLSRGGTGHGASSCAPWMAGGWPATGRGPVRLGGGATASGPAPRGPTGPRTSAAPAVAPRGRTRGWFLLGVVGNFSSSAQARVGRAPGWRFFFTVWKRWEGAQMREVGASARKTPPEPGARGPGSGGGSPRLRVSWRCRPCRESWWGRRALLLLLLVAGRV